MWKILLVLAILVLVALLTIMVIGIITSQQKNTGAQQTPTLAPETPLPSLTPSAQPTSIQTKNMKHLITIKTNYGEIQLGTYDNDTPKTVQNFITLAQKGFYNNLTFHRIIKDFMIQGGDPKGDGTGGPGYTFADELNPNTDSYKEGYKKGVVAMANAGPNTNGSQFFIMLKDTDLPHDYTIFGRVVKGQEVVDAIGNISTDKNDKPLSPVIMENVTVQPFLQ